MLIRLRPEPSIHSQNLTGYKLRGGREEENRCGDFFPAAIALHRGLPGHAFHEGGSRLFA